MKLGVPFLQFPLLVTVGGDPNSDATSGPMSDAQARRAERLALRSLQT